MTAAALRPEGILGQGLESDGDGNKQNMSVHNLGDISDSHMLLQHLRVIHQGKAGINATKQVLKTFRLL